MNVREYTCTLAYPSSGFVLFLRIFNTLSSPLPRFRFSTLIVQEDEKQSILCAASRDTMLKLQSVLNEAPGKNKTMNQKTWPILVQQKNHINKEISHMNELGRPGVPRPRGILRGSYYGEINISTATNDAESFHCAISSILVLAQFFGVLPVSGIRAMSPVKLKFVKISFRTLYAVFITMMILGIEVFAFIHMIKTLNAAAFEVQGGIPAATAGAIFYGNSLLGTIAFFWLSPHWVSLQRDWRAMEQFIDSNKPGRPRLRWKFILISALVLSLALAEHIMSIANGTEHYEWDPAKNASFYGFLQYYCENTHAFVLEEVEYNFAFGIYIFIISKLATFTWNFTDLFVMLVSTGLAERYKSLNKKVIDTVCKRLTVDWRELREEYASLSAMVKKVDDKISPIILLSFANNLYFICLQLLNGLSRSGENTTISAVYFFGSFAFLIGRTCAVTLLTARIHDQSKLALPYLYTCSTNSYNAETQRLQYQLTTDDIALTGLRFFSITRNFMLAVAGAIVTYEVVLLQFNVAMNH
ncbi:hypothetical protein KM043_009957 [Ampulex compressa]|nr:hypothetical protein KM043_009957 [Ampulex compressa]